MTENKNPSISIIMPAYNAGAHVGEAVSSVISQTYPNWELLIVNDGSRDDTLTKLQSFDDPRIRIFSQGKKGVSAARNKALEEMKGDFFCFLDADDVMPPRSLEARLRVFEKNPHTVFADGKVRIMDETLSQTINQYSTSFKGDPFFELASLNESCFLGLTWMIKVLPGKAYRFHEGMTHGEDLLFFLELSEGGRYDHTGEEVLFYRKGHVSAMGNLEGLEKGYLQIYTWLKQSGRIDRKALVLLKRKMGRIMGRSWWKKGRIFRGLKSIGLFYRLS